jgi:DNA polymerase V
MQPIPIQAVPVPLQGFVASVYAGFPSPAADHAQKRIDLNEHLIRNKEATFLFRVRGDSMTGVGIYQGDTLLVDSSIDPRHNAIVLAVLNNEFTVKRLYRRGGGICLLREPWGSAGVDSFYSEGKRLTLVSKGIASACARVRNFSGRAVDC